MGGFPFQELIMKRSLLSEIEEMAESADEDQLRVLERSLEGDPRIGVRRALEKARRRLEACNAEGDRLASLYDFALESAARVAPDASLDRVLGLDEVGRGSLAGPLAVGAVILDPSRPIEGLDDSKRLPAPARERISARIEEHAVAWHVEYVDPGTIDRIGIMAALRQAFLGAIGAVEGAGHRIDAILLDGNPLGLDRREANVVKGDSRCAPISAASIVAKVHRDALMTRLDEDLPGYGFASNKGYGTESHRLSIRELGLSEAHRRSFCTEFLQDSLF